MVTRTESLQTFAHARKMAELPVDGPLGARFLEALVGRELRTVTGRPNRVLRLEGDQVVVGTARSPAGQSVPIEWVQDALNRLETKGEIEISVDSVGHRSAFVGAVLLELPGARIVHDASPPRIRLQGAD